MQQITTLQYSKRNIITKNIETCSPKQMGWKGLMIHFYYYYFEFQTSFLNQKNKKDKIFGCIYDLI